MEILKLTPVFKDYLWGGTRLKTDFGFKSDFDKVAEGWMLSCHKDGKNTIDGGKFDGKALDDVIEIEGKEKIVGTRSLDFPYFPVLIKLIDAKDNLSIQVHPDNDYAQRVEGEFGKTEIWYVIDATDGAELVYGFKNEISSEEFKNAIEDNTLLDVLNTVKVKKGDLFFIEAGTVHAIGKGVLIAEIQQNSNSTYRVYDYGRVGADGKPRELHVKKAVDVAVTEPPKYDIKPMGQPEQNDGYVSTLLTKCDLFTVNHYDVEEKITLNTDEKSFNHVLVVDGSGEINGVYFKKGDSYFVPASYGDYEITGKCELIVTNI
ncbi:MAG: type I phosphomannose isomerase catalytic subunit [Eubacterium sp.]